MTRSNSLTQAAIVLNSLPKRQAAELLSRLDAGDMKSVLEAASSLGEVPEDRVDECLNKLKMDSRTFGGEVSELGSDDEYVTESPEVERAKRQLDKALSVVPRVFSQSKESQRPFEFLLDTIPTLRNHVLSDEHPRNIAVVLSTFPPDVASATMSSLDSIQRVSVLKRMCELGEIHDDEVTQLSYAIRMRLNKLLGSQAGKSAGLKSAADLLSCSDSATREELLAHVGQSDPDMADSLERSVFDVEAMCKLDDQDVKTVLKNVDTSCWAPALKNGSPTLIDKILNNMAQTPRELLSHEIAEFGHVESNQEDLARKNIVQTILRLAREGKVDLRSRVRAPNAVFSESNAAGVTINRCVGLN